MTDAKSRLLLWTPALIALLFYFWSTFQHDLSRKEAREGIPIVNMAHGESIWLPKINDARYRTKPPMFYWTGLMVSKVLGKADKISLRLPSVLAGAGVVFLTTLLGFWLYSPTTGALAGFITATSLQFSFFSTIARIDMLFTFFILLAWTSFWRMMHDPDAKTRARFSWLAATALGFAFLTKGPLGLIFPLLALFIYSRTVKVKIPWPRLFLIPLAMTLIWVIEGSIEGGNEFKAMIYRETIGRITNDPTIGYHNKPFYYYFILLAYGFLPWSLFLPVVLWQGLTVHRKNPHWIFPAVAVGTLFIFLSFISGKQGAYLIPISPMAALLTAHGLSVAVNENNRLTKGWAVSLWAVMGVLIALAVLLLLLAGNPNILSHIYNLEFIHYSDRWLTERFIRDHSPSGIVLMALSAIVLFIATAIGRALQKNSALQASYYILGLTFLTLLIFLGPVANAMNQYSLKPFGRQVGQIVGERPLIHPGIIKEDLLFFIGHPVQEETTEKAVQILTENPEAYLVIPSEQGKEVIASHPDFQVVLETDHELRRHYQLINKIPPALQQ